MTLNQVISRLKKLGNAHSQINHVDFCEITEFLSRGDFNYPAICIEFPSVVIDRTNRLTRYKFPIWVCDKMNVDLDARGNETEVQSDLISIAEDFAAMASSTVFQDEWTVDEVHQLSMASEALNDYCVTVSFDIEIAVEYDSNRCQIPNNGSITFIES